MNIALLGAVTALMVAMCSALFAWAVGRFDMVGWTIPIAALVVFTEVAPAELDQPLPPQLFELAIAGPLLATCAVVALMTMRDEMFRMLRRPPLCWVVALIGLGVVLSPVSQDPVRSFQLSVAAFCMVFIAIASVRRDGWESAMKALVLGLVVFAVGSLAWELVGPGTRPTEAGSFDTGFGGLPRRAGLASNPNQLGRVGALTVAIGIGTIGRPGMRSLTLWSAAAGVALLALSQSRTAILAATVAVAVALLRQGRRILTAVAVSVSVLLPAAAFAAGVIEIDSLTRTGAGTEEITSLTGRTDLWAGAFSQSLERPILGHGAFASEPALEPLFKRGAVSFRAEDAHSLLINTLLTNGVVGALILLVGTWSAIRLAHERRRPGLEDGMVALGIISLTETIFWKPNSSFLAIAVGFAALSLSDTISRTRAEDARVASR